jgi:microcystin-dependent protein
MEWYIGQIMQVAFNYAPADWATCAGQTLAISQNQALFALIGSTFGGNGTTTFALPNMQSRVMVGVGQGSGLRNYAWGQIGGNEQASLGINNMPAHNHTATFTPSGGGASAVQALTGVLPASLTGTPVEGSLLANTAPGGPNQPKIYAPADSGTAVNLGGVSGGGGGGSVQIGVNGSSSPFDILSPYVAVYTNICLSGIWPTRP